MDGCPLTAATSHMFCECHLISSYTSSTDNETVSVEDKCALIIAGWGSIFKNWITDGIQTVVLHSALYIPQLTTNLISLGTLQHNGASFHSVNSRLVVTMGKDDLFHTTLHRTLYYVNHTSNTGTEVAYAVSSGSLHLWHRWMGHLHLDAICKLDQKSMVNGLTITSPKSYNHICEGCVSGKSHCLMFPNASHTHYEKMELIVVDLSGPMSVATWTGKAYAFIVVEMNSWLGIRELLETKAEAAKTIKTGYEIRITIWKEIKAVTYWCWSTTWWWISVGKTVSYMKRLFPTLPNRMVSSNVP
jgi:hypothetical protein